LSNDSVKIAVLVADNVFGIFLIIEAIVELTIDSSINRCVNLESVTEAVSVIDSVLDIFFPRVLTPVAVPDID
jgi:hypothetical protein